jgi:hypothetical protein
MKPDQILAIFLAVVLVVILAALTGCAEDESRPGWLLMFPPLTAKGYPNTSAPYLRWQTVGTYPSQTDCNSAIDRGRFAAAAQFGQIERGENYEEGQAVQIRNAQCIATEDPRLTE